MQDKNYQEGYRHAQEDSKSGKGNCLESRALKRLFKIGAYLPGAENRDYTYREGYLSGHRDFVRTINVASVDLRMSQEMAGSDLNNYGSDAEVMGKNVISGGDNVFFSKRKNNGGDDNVRNIITGANTGAEMPWVGVTKKHPGNAEVRAHVDAVQNRVDAITASAKTNFKPGGSMSDQQSLAYQIELLDDLKRHIQSMQSQMDAMMRQYESQVQGLRDAGMTTERHNRLQHEMFEPTDMNMRKFIEYLQENDLVIVAESRDQVEALLAYETRGGR